MVNNSRFLILPGVRVPHLASHALGLAVRRLAGDWEAAHGARPALAYTFVGPEHAGTCYAAAGWELAGETSGAPPGRRDGAPACGVRLRPLEPGWRQRLRSAPEAAAARWLAAGPPALAEAAHWTELEFGYSGLADGRLRRRITAMTHRAAAFFVTVPAGAEVTTRMIGRLRQQLGEAASGQSDLASGHRVTITRAWALHRARRGNLAISDVGDVVELDVDSLRVIREPQPQSRLAARLQGPVKTLLRVWTRLRRHLATVFGTALRIRSPKDAGRFIAMIVRAVWWRVGNVRWKLRRVRKRLKIWLGLQARSRRYVPRLARYPLGAEITASGRVASAVLAASARVASSRGDHHVDILLVDSPAAARSVASGPAPHSRPAVAVLDELSPRLSVQAFDAEDCEPHRLVGGSRARIGDAALAASLRRARGLQPPDRRRRPGRAAFPAPRRRPGQFPQKPHPQGYGAGSLGRGRGAGPH